MINKNSSLIAFLIAIISAFSIAKYAYAADAYMFLSSGSGTFLSGKEISPRMVINSGGSPGINAADGSIQFDPAFLKVKSISIAKSLFELWPQKPVFSNEKGTISFSGGLPKQFSDSAGVIFNIVFTPKKSGKTMLSFTSGTVLSADGKAKNILADKLEGYYYIGNSAEVRSAEKLAERLSGRILLQTQRNGEAWYLYPKDKRRYFLGRPLDAFTIMRKLGLGASHKYISSNKIFPIDVWGRILLDVEKNGEAYYVSPVDKKAYYLGRPKDAFRIMREKGLGIANDQLYRIPDWAI
jgi:hypothetical protein